MKLHQGPVFIDGMVNSTLVVGSSLQDKFRKGHPKSVVVPEIIDAVRQLILQDIHQKCIDLNREYFEKQ